MGTYSNDRPWSDSFIPELRRLIGPHLLSPSSFEQDTCEAADLVVLKARDMTIACRVRRPEYAMNFRGEFTLRCKRDSGAKTELAKVAEGWGDWFFYGFATGVGVGIYPWSLIDLSAFRAAFVRQGFTRNGSSTTPTVNWGRRSNGDGTAFAWFEIASFPSFPPLVIASSSSSLADDADVGGSSAEA
jgi:hypothetical protein